MGFKWVGQLCLTVPLCLAVSMPAYAQTSLKEYLSGFTEEKTEDLPAPAAEPRASGMDLSGEEGATVNPFAPPPPSPATQMQKTQEQMAQEIRQQAFDAALTGLLPMEPAEIRALMERFDQTKQAVEVPIYPYPEPEIAATTVSLDPGSTPTIIKVATGHVTTLSMLDITGEPWPIQDISWAGSFEMGETEEGSNIVRIIPMAEFTHGNISMRLVGLTTPVSFTLKTSRDSVFYRLDARIPEFGPQAETPLIEGGIALVAGNSPLNAILDGVPPSGAARLVVSGADSRTTAYTFNDLTYVRTPLTLLSPAWTSSVSSADGMNVYTLADAPVLLLSDRGQIVRARLSEKGGQDE